MKSRLVCNVSSDLIPHPSSLVSIALTIIPALCVLAGCASAPRAPVVERVTVGTNKPAAKSANAAPKESGQHPEFYTVKKGDTLFSIALEHGLDYKELAQWNGVDNPNVIHSGQQLRISPPSGGAVASPIKAPVTVAGRPVGNTDTLKTEPRAVKRPYSEQAVVQAKAEPLREKEETKPQTGQPAGNGDNDGHIDWAWPANGKVLSTFSESTKGVDIAGKQGQPVYASAAGEVLYSGSGIRGYGKLIVIKHNNGYSTVYAHNSEILVKEGQTVAKGQKIAEMGDSDAEQVKLHFEIRRLGKPVDPMKYLPNGKIS